MKTKKNFFNVYEVHLLSSKINMRAESEKWSSLSLQFISMARWILYMTHYLRRDSWCDLNYFIKDSFISYKLEKNKVSFQWSAWYYLLFYRRFNSPTLCGKLLETTKNAAFDYWIFCRLSSELMTFLNKWLHLTSN